jgi:putative DNA primase/helicase
MSLQHCYRSTHMLASVCISVAANNSAADVGAAIAYMPAGEANNFDANDLGQRDGLDVVATILDGAIEPPIAYPLSVAFAEELSDSYESPDELVQGVLTAGDGCVLYGDSNSGKTFIVIDLACAVARGTEWMGRKTEPGLVVYLAAESPSSVRRRLPAYQKHHRVKVPNFAVVQSPIDLFAGEADTYKVIKLVRMIEAKRGQTVRLIIGDTLARLSAGANENSGQDMGLVVRHFDRIRAECKAHFLLIHHSGKNAAAGSRGWSGIRAAVDTEIEVTDTPTGRCLEITKQRDLPTKGERIGFRLDVLTLGQTKWGGPATSCVVTAADAPVKQNAKRRSECDGAVLEFLVAHKTGIKKRDVVTHFEGRYEKGPIYRAMKALVTAAAIHEAAGMVCAAGVAK